MYITYYIRIWKWIGTSDLGTLDEGKRLSSLCGGSFLNSSIVDGRLAICNPRMRFTRRTFRIGDMEKWKDVHSHHHTLHTPRHMAKEVWRVRTMIHNEWLMEGFEEQAAGFQCNLTDLHTEITQVRVEQSL